MCDTEEPVQTMNPDNHRSSEPLTRTDSRKSTSSSLRRINTRDLAPGEPNVPTPASFDDSKKEVKDEPYFHSLDGSAPFPQCHVPREDCIIDWQSNEDLDNPQNWSSGKKLYCMFIVSMSAMVTVFGSAIAGPASPGVKKEFHVGTAPAALMVALYVMGFAVGPIIWGPMSEQMGRRLPIVLGLFGLVVFSFACATAKDFQTLVLSRFFAGALGASTISVTPVIPADIFTAQMRGKGITIIVLMIIAGPMLAPVIGGYISSSYLGWRWTFYILGIIASFLLILATFFLPETYAATILVSRAKRIRSYTGNWMVVAKLETQEFAMSDLIERTLLRPIRMLFVEPILLLISVYHGFIYGILYLCLECVPIIFSNYGWQGGNIYLPYLGMLVGSIIVICVNLFIFEPRFDRVLAKSTEAILPEERLPLMMLSGIIFPMGIFLLCWSGAYQVMWFVPTLGCAFIGFALIGIFMTAFNYIIDTYLILAASAIAANTFLRSGMGGSMPIYATPLFLNLGTQWAGTLLGCVSVLLTPVPFLFYFYGKRIRSKSKYAVVLPSPAKPKPETSEEEA